MVDIHVQQGHKQHFGVLGAAESILFVSNSVASVHRASLRKKRGSLQWEDAPCFRSAAAAAAAVRHWLGRRWRVVIFRLSTSLHIDQSVDERPPLLR